MTRPKETQPERKARHLDTLREVTETCLDLARKTAAKAREALEAPDPVDTKQPRRPDYHAIFDRHARTIRTLIALEARIAEDKPPRAARAPASAPPDADPEPVRPPDPRRDLLRSALHDSVRAHPERTRICRQMDAAIDRALAADLDQERPAGVVLVDLCRVFGLTLDLSRLPDALLETEPRALARATTGPPD